ncbi:MAG: SDR family NAD(P)-dependent oxidoreductase [Gemmatimonadaceae bacterium]
MTHPPSETPRPRALVTGSTAGIGRAFAGQLARLGYDLVLVARDAKRLAEVAREVELSTGRRSAVLAADLSDDGAVARIVAHIDEQPVDVLVNNAGFGSGGPLVRSDRGKQEAMIRLHVLAVSRLTQAALPAMIARRHGAIIVVSSTASYLTSAGNVNYCATKAYQRIFAESLSLEVGRHGVYVQALCPGFTHTEFHERAGVDKRRVPAWMWMSADRVVAASLAAMRAGRGPVVVPGWGYRLMVTGLRYAPRWLRAVEAKMYRRDR